MISGCPNPHSVILHQRRATNHEVLTDNCDTEHGGEWLATEGATDKDAEIIIDLGCIKTLKSIRLKNIKKSQGGTKMFTIFYSNSEEGPWEVFVTDELAEAETDECGFMQFFTSRYIQPKRHCF